MKDKMLDFYSKRKIFFGISIGIIAIGLIFNIIFGVSLDELMGYDKEKVDQKIEELIAEFWRLYRKDWRAAYKLIEDAYRAYPNDYRVMYRYMWSRGVDDAEPDLDLALKYKDEFTRICDKIIGGCTDGSLRQETTLRFGGNDWCFSGDNLLYTALSVNDKGVKALPASELLGLPVSAEPLPPPFTNSFIAVMPPDTQFYIRSMINTTC